MLPAAQKDDAFLADVAAARAAGRSRLWWLGQSGFLLYTPAATVLFDPYLSDSLTRKYAGTDRPHVRLTERVIAPGRLTGIAVITSSHNHTDHLDAETLLPLLAANPQARLLIPRANRAFVLNRLGDVADRLEVLDAGESITLAGVEFHGIPAAHDTVERDAAGCHRFLGYVARVAGRTVYHSGDTRWHGGLPTALKPFRPHLALVPINGHDPARHVAGNLNGREAAQLAAAIGAVTAIPHHFDLFAFNTAPPDEFIAECHRLGQGHHVLRNGEGMWIEF